MIHASDKDASCTTFWAGKRGLYILLRHRGLRVDVINEDDVLDGPTIAKYPTLYITDPHVSAAATTAIADWVAAGGTLYATASGGLFDHANAVNTPMQTLLGLQYFAVPPKSVVFATPVVRASQTIDDRTNSFCLLDQDDVCQCLPVGGGDEA